MIVWVLDLRARPRGRKTEKREKAITGGWRREREKHLTENKGKPIINGEGLSQKSQNAQLKRRWCNLY